MEYSKKDKLNIGNINTQESDFFNLNSPNQEDFNSLNPQKTLDKYIEIKSNYEIGFETEKSFYSSLEKQINKNISNEQENINTDPNDKIKDLLLENKNLLKSTIALKEKLYSQEAKENKFLEKEQLYKKQLDINKKKVEQCDIYQNQLKERENYIEELISRYNALEKEYQQIVTNKDIEIKDLKNRIAIEVLNKEKLQNQINYLTETSNNITKDLMKDMNLLEEKKRDLETKLSQVELFYSQEILNLNKKLELNNNNTPVEQKSNTLNNKKSDLEKRNSHNDRFNNNLKNSSETVVEMKYQLEKQRTGEFAIDTNRGSENNYSNQQNLIDELKKELINIKIENEKLLSDLKNEKDLNNILQQNNNDQKYLYSKVTNNQPLSKLSSPIKAPREFSPKSHNKGDDTELIKKKLAETENYLLEINENNDILLEKLNKMQENNNFLEKENRMLGEQVDILMNKLDKINKFNGKFTKDLLVKLSNISDLNSTVSILKLREKELVEKVEFYENSSLGMLSKKISSNFSDYNNTNIDKNMNLPSIKNSNIYSKKKFTAFQKEFSSDKYESREEKRNLTFRGNCSYNLYDNLLIINTDKFDLIEPRSIRDDNVFLKEQNFKYINELQKLNDEMNNLKIKLNTSEDIRNQVQREKEETDLRCLGLQNELKLRLASLSSLEELKTKLETFSEMNIILNNNFIKLQEKVEQQNQKILDKNAVIKEQEKAIEVLLNEKQSILSERNNYSDTVKMFEKEIETIRKQTISKDPQAQEKIHSLRLDNKKLIEKIKQKKKTIEDLYDEIKKKDDKLKTILQERTDKNQTIVEENERFKLDFIKLKQEIELLVKENSRIKDQLKEKSDNTISSNSKARNSKRDNKNNLRLSTSFDNALIKDNKQNNDNSVNKKRKNINYNQNYLTDLENESECKEEMTKLQNDLFIRNKNQKNKCTDDLQHLKKRLRGETQEKEVLTKKLNEEKIEKDKYLELNKKLEETINKQVLEISQLKTQISHFETIQKQINEMSSNQEKVSQIFLELEKIKQEDKKKVDNLENCINELTKKLKKAQTEYENLKKSTSLSISALKNENLSLIKLLKDKENEIHSINNEKNTVINSNNKIELKGELCKIKEEFQTTIINLTENYEKIIEKTNRNKTRLEKLKKTHGDHLNFLIDRFKQHITELIHVMNSMRLGNKYLQENPIFNERFLKNVETFTSLLNNLSQTESSLNYHKNENKTLKNNISLQNTQIKNLTIENNIFKEELKIKKLQQKGSTVNDKSDEMEILRKINNYAVLIQENSNIRQKESKLKIKLETKESELKLLKSQLDNYKDQVTNLNTLISNKEIELKLKEKENSDMIKSNKADLAKNMDEITKIKEKWIPPEKYNEKLETISNLEKIIKSLKEDIERKKELLNHYKNGGGNEELNTKIINLQDKIKDLNSEIIKKDTKLKNTNSKIEEIEDSNRKLLLENSTLNNQVYSLKLNNTKDNLAPSNKGEFLDYKYTKLNDTSRDYRIEILNRENEQLKLINEESKQILLMKNDLCERLFDILKKIYQDLITQFEFALKQTSIYNEEKTSIIEWKELACMIDNSSLNDSYKIAEIFIMMKEKILFNYKIMQKKDSFFSNDKYISSHNQSYRGNI